MHSIVDEKHLLLGTDTTDPAFDGSVVEHRLQRLEIIQHRQRELPHLDVVIFACDFLVAHLCCSFIATVMPLGTRIHRPNVLLCDHRHKIESWVTSSAGKSTIREKNHR